MFIPKSYKTRDKILSFLCKARDGKSEQDPKFYDSIAFSIQQIATELKLNEKEVSEQLDFLFKSKDIHVRSGLGTFMATPEGLATNAERKFINEGKILNSQLYNNYASTVFQLLTGVSLVLSIFINLTTVQELQKQNTDIQEGQSKTEQHIKELEERVKTQSNSSDTTSFSQTNE